jgi:glucose-1-phosphate adenylyltransferase
VAVDDTERVTGFVEKPPQPPSMPGQSNMSLASMGV